MAGELSKPAETGMRETPAERRRVEVAIAIVFGADQKLLICKRKAEAVLGGYWEFPGGKCNPGETPADCAVREVEEETGLCVNVQQAARRDRA